MLKDRIVKDVWRDKKSTDFLSYMKFEFIQYSYHGSVAASGIVVMLNGYREVFTPKTDNSKQKQDLDNRLKVYNGCFILGHILAATLLQTLLSRYNSRKQKGIGRALFKIASLS